MNCINDILLEFSNIQKLVNSEEQILLLLLWIYFYRSDNFINWKKSNIYIYILFNQAFLQIVLFLYLICKDLHVKFDIKM